MSWGLSGGSTEPPPARIPFYDQPSELLAPSSTFPQESSAAVLDEAAELYQHLRRIHYVWAAVSALPAERGEGFLSAWNTAATKYRTPFVEVTARAA